MASMNCLLALAITGLVLVSLPSLSHCDDDVVDPHRGRELAADECTPSGKVELKPNRNRNPKCQGCCRRNQTYPTYDCSPPTSASGTGRTKAVMTLHDFDPLAPRGNVETDECNDRFNPEGLVVALSTGWYANPRRCHKYIQIYTNGSIVPARVVGECDSQDGCNVGTDYLPPCGPNTFAASRAVWEMLGLDATGDETDRKHNVTWSDVRR